MLTRFLLGLGLGSGTSALVYAVTTDGALTALIGITVAVLIWFGAFILDDLL
ncbi:hypothetical protein [Streptomyces sp. AC1-42T]|uniref:hypothetical protein n=1 Tax=Streptomyces sp. AC1-42T TaxID=2218665 RepID=UPI0013140095|nr:hypothetical protein [Streptomyces sp. AC1-42T]